ncbi:FtsX-like permease family protein [Paucibacter sp. APW11]|uniref:FtsX-like permease family protein n=1 Tax=Roseateles aquae TaxID=3077235 RepID=A0ABU3PHH3_9BURK|nr:FtsX-like permease family protein [Paucibacter sp. APW11]MDT9001812.1 FtsX-like permease family protein [Paucibacter sp. APW11]
MIRLPSSLQVLLHLRPIFSSLLRHKTAAGLIVLEVALSCAIISNAVFLIGQRLAAMQIPSGLQEAGLLVLRYSSYAKGQDLDAISTQDLALLRALPGVQSAALVNQLPFGNHSSSGGVSVRADDASGGFNVGWYNVGEGWLQSMGVRLIEGRDFRPDEYRTIAQVRADEGQKVRVALINKALAQQLFPGESALGREIYPGGPEPVQVIGIVDELIRARPSDLRSQGPGSLIVPLRTDFSTGLYLLRVDPAQQDTLLKAATARLDAEGGRRLLASARPFAEQREAYFRQDRYMAALLGLVCLLLLVVTALGIVGLASFWVRQRQRMIGTRRALGATRRQILHYFQLENLLLTGTGLLLGTLGAFGINLLLMLSYEVPRLPLAYLPVGAGTLLLLGQLAVLGPARRAAELPPVAALRA